MNIKKKKMGFNGLTNRCKIRLIENCIVEFTIINVI